MEPAIFYYEEIPHPGKIYNSPKKNPTQKESFFWE
jgi:hypothetical protein